MIFLTVGTQLPFDRLVKAVDAWAGEENAASVFAQISETDYRPTHMEWVTYLPAPQFRQKLAEASVIVSHAGMGTLLTGLQAQKPLIVMPRRFGLGEIRNEHQLATAKWLRQLPGVTVCDDTDDLVAVLRRGDWQTPSALSPNASPELLATVRDFIEAS